MTSDTTRRPNSARRAIDIHIRRSKSVFGVVAMAIAAIVVGIGVSLSQPTSAATVTVISDMEFSDPAAAGWFSFGGSVGGGGISSSTDSLPPANGGATALTTGWGSGGAAGFYGGFGLPTTATTTGATNFEMWINPTVAGQEYTLEINLQDSLTPGGAIDDEFQYNCVVSASGPCAIAGGGWQLVSIPFTDFFDDSSVTAGGNGLLDTDLINVVVVVIGTGTDANFTTDYWVLASDTAPPSSSVVDDFESGLSSGVDGDGVSVGFVTFNDAASTIAITDTDATPADTRPGAATGNKVLQMTNSVVGYAGFVHAFTNAATDTWESQDWSAFEGVRMWVYGQGTNTSMFIDVLDNRAPGSTTDDAERYSTAFVDDFVGWRQLSFPFTDFTRKEIGNGAPNDGFNLTQVHGWALGDLNTPGETTFYIDEVELYGTAPVVPLAVTFGTALNQIAEGTSGAIEVKLSRALTDADPAEVTVDYTTEVGTALAGRNYTPASGTLTFTNGGPSTQTFAIPTVDDGKFTGDLRIGLRLTNPVGASAGYLMQASALINDAQDFDPKLLDDFENGPYLWEAATGTTMTTPVVGVADVLARPDQAPLEGVLSLTSGGATVSASREFAMGSDWSTADSLEFWYYGSGNGEDVTVNLADNRAPDPGPSGWSLVWADEFDEAAGTPPNPNNWTFETGDVTPDGKNGWGNEELQYYTDDPANASTDGNGNMKITVLEADGSQLCYYGPCEYTSARLLSDKKAEFAYGRIESRIKVPVGGGIWPAFWSLGSDISYNPWPGTGEIDFMEYVGRLPDEIFGTIHGPGYAGGASYGDTYTFADPVANDYHTYAVEWEPDHIKWYVDDVLYHEATPADVAPNAWVFNDPVFLLLNVAMGGNFGGAVSSDFTAPQSMLVDYVRVYQGPDTAERFNATFADDTAGWTKVTVPFTDFTRSAVQPTDAPDDGLGLTEVWGYGFDAPATAGSPVYVDEVRLVATPGTGIVTNANNAGPGSLRQALSEAGDGGTVVFDPAMAGQTIPLTSALVPVGDVTIDGSAAPGVIVDGGDAVRVLETALGQEVAINDLTFKNGYGYQLGGCVLNLGTLNLTRVTIEDCTTTGDTGQFWQGGAGIYNAENSSLALTDSTVRNNSTHWDGGGIMSFFGTTTQVARSTISGNTATDVGGGLRTLGTLNVDNSTISTNEAVAWNGGALFATDGVSTITNSTIVDNVGPDSTTGGLFVGTFSDSAASMILQNNLIAGNSIINCVEGHDGPGPVSITSAGNNVVGDGTCGAVTNDIVTDSASYGPLADNGGSTMTHKLLAGSPAIDAASAAACPATDQIGTPRPQGDNCDVGAFEVVVDVPVTTTSTTSTTSTTTSTTIKPTTSTSTTVKPTTSTSTSTSTSVKPTTSTSTTIKPATTSTSVKPSTTLKPTTTTGVGTTKPTNPTPSTSGPTGRVPETGSSTPVPLSLAALFAVLVGALLVATRRSASSNEV